MITLIMAADDAGGIGYKDGLPWPKDHKDMMSFVRHTYGKPCLLSEQLHSQIGSKLHGRDFVIVGRNINWRRYQCSDQEYMLLGGARVCLSGFDYVNDFILHRVRGVYQADTFCPFDLPWVPQ